MLNPMSGNSDSTIFYTPLQRRLHWLTLLLLLVQYALQWPMKQAMDAIERQQSLDLGGFLVTTAHTWGGIAIAAVMIWRWQLRRREVPLLAGGLSAAQERWVRRHHVSLYVVVVLMTLSGILHYYFEITVAARWHAWGKWVLALLILVHVAGALSHGRAGLRVLQRMMWRDGAR